MQFIEEIILKDLDLGVFELKTYETIDSTNDECKRISSAKDVLVITADKQTKGKGRKGKTWQSPKGNISLSVAFADKEFGVPVSIATGILVTKSLSQVLNCDSVGLKWPNDLIFKGKKIGGILVEKEVYAKFTKTIVGIGINLELEHKESWWGDLQDFQQENLRDHLINKILLNFEQFLKNGLPDWQNLWDQYCIHNQKKISVVKNQLTFEGKYFGIDHDGALLLENQHKEIIPFSSGEVSIKGIYNS